MSALAFDPWAGLKRGMEDSRPTDRDGPGGVGLGALAVLAGVPSSPCQTAHNLGTPESDDEPPPLLTFQGLPDAEWVEGMAEALAANPVNRIEDPAKALLYYRGRALAMLDATPDPLARGLLLGWERNRRQTGFHLP